VKGAGIGTILTAWASNVELMLTAWTGPVSGAWTRLTNKATSGGERIEKKQRGDTSETCRGSMALSWAGIRHRGTARRLRGKEKSHRCRNWLDARQSKKRKLTEAVEQLVAEGGHHLVDAEGMAGLELRPVDDGVIDEMVGAGIVDDEDFDESD